MSFVKITQPCTYLLRSRRALSGLASGLALAVKLRVVDTRDRLLRRSFHAAGQPARTQIGGRSRCPWVTASDRSFPPVLARTWHGCGYPRWLLTPGPGVVGRHGPLAPSFRSQAPTPTASAAVCLTWKRSSVSVCWRPP